MAPPPSTPATAPRQCQCKCVFAINFYCKQSVSINFTAKCGFKSKTASSFASSMAYCPIQLLYDCLLSLPLSLSLFQLDLPAIKPTVGFDCQFLSAFNEITSYLLRRALIKVIPVFYTIVLCLKRFEMLLCPSKL